MSDDKFSHSATNIMPTSTDGMSNFLSVFPRPYYSTHHSMPKSGVIGSKKLYQTTVRYIESARIDQMSVLTLMWNDFLGIRSHHLIVFTIHANDPDHKFYMSRGARKPVFGVSDQVRHKLG